MTIIGYTTVLSDNNLIEIEITGEYEYTDKKWSTPNIHSTYHTNKCKILKAYDVYGNEILQDNESTETQTDIYMCKVGAEYEYDKNTILFVFDFETGLNELRQKLFFDEKDISIPGDFGFELDNDSIYPHYIELPLYKKKDDITINFCGVQKIYDTPGILDVEFYHINGKKEGDYKIYHNNKIYTLNFVNDEQIGTFKKEKYY
jgi:hypothetical protein